jgi:hypothetical protein
MHAAEHGERGLMPIRPENRDRYPANWEQIRLRIQQRAGNACERCHVRNGAWGYRDPDGTFHRVNKREMIDAVRRGREFVRPPFNLGPHKIIEIVCTTAHIDHTPEHCTDDNLLFLCQRCHLAHDAPHHAQTAYATRRAGKAIGDLFV